MKRRLIVWVRVCSGSLARWVFFWLPERVQQWCIERRWAAFQGRKEVPLAVRARVYFADWCYRDDYNRLYGPLGER